MAGASLGCSRREAELVALLRQQAPLSEVKRLGCWHIMLYGVQQQCKCYCSCKARLP